jgi:hypothetical protein
MTDYSRMSYEQLRGIADNDAIAEQMSEEEYEALSTQMWRKFGIEQGIREHLKPLAPNPTRISTLRAILNRLRPKSAGDKQSATATNRGASPRELTGLFRSGD